MLTTVLLGGCASQPRKVPAQWTARLQFRLVTSDTDTAADEMFDPFGGKPLRVLPQVLLDERDVSDARVNSDDVKNPTEVIVDFTPDGREKFQQFTSGHLNQRVAVVLDGKLLAAPRILAVVGESAVISRPPNTGDVFDVWKVAKAIRSALSQARRTSRLNTQNY